MTMFESTGPNLHYNGLDHEDAGELVSAVRDWSYSVAEIEDSERVLRLLERLERAVDVVLVEQPASRPSERGTSFEGAPRRVGESDLNV